MSAFLQHTAVNHTVTLMGNVIFVCGGINSESAAIGPLKCRVMRCSLIPKQFVFSDLRSVEYALHRRYIRAGCRSTDTVLTISTSERFFAVH